jgi:hypothetical protein
MLSDLVSVSPLHRSCLCLLAWGEEPGPVWDATAFATHAAADQTACRPVVAVHPTTGLREDNPEEEARTHRHNSTRNSRPRKRPWSRVDQFLPMLQVNVCVLRFRLVSRRCHLIVTINDCNLALFLKKLKQTLQEGVLADNTSCL